MGNQVGTAIFQVQSLPAAVGMISTAAGAIPSGQAVVQDGMAPQAYGFSGAAAIFVTWSHVVYNSQQLEVGS
jgi:hypothetical protein